MGVQVDTIESLLVANVGKYIADMDTATAAFKRFKAEHGATSGANDDAAVEQSAAKQTAAATKTADTRKRVAKDAADSEAASARASADAVAVAEQKKRDAIAATAAAEKVALEARLDANAAQRVINDRTVSLSPARVGGASETGDRSTAARQTEIMAATRVEAEAVVEAEKKINYLALDLYDLTQKRKVAEGEVVVELDAQIANLQRLRAYKAQGLSDDQASLRAQSEALALQKLQTEQAEKQDLVQAAGRNSGTSGALKFAEGAGLGRTGGSLPAIGGIVAAGAVAGLIELAKTGLEYADSLSQVSKQLGITTKDLQIYQAAAQSIGVKNEQLQESFAHLNDSLGKAQEGSQQQQKIFKALNVDIGNAKDGYKNLSDLLPTLSDRLSQISDKQQRNAIETALGGEQLAKLDPILSQGSAAFDKFGRAVEGTSGFLSDQQIQDAAKTAEKLRLLGDQLQRDLASTVANNAQAIESLASAFLHAADSALKFFDAAQRAGTIANLEYPIIAHFTALTNGQSDQQVDAASRQSLLASPAGRQQLFDLNNRQLQDFNKQSQVGDQYGVSVKDQPARTAELAKLNDQRREIVMAQAAYLKGLRTATSVPVVPGKVGDTSDLFAPKGPKGKSAETLAKEAEERQKRYEDELAQSRAEYLTAQRQLTAGTENQYNLDKAAIVAAGKKKDADIDAQAKLKQIDAARVEELKAANDSATLEKLAVLALQKKVAAENAVTDAALAQIDLQKSLNSTLGAFADTTKQKLALALNQIDLDQQAANVRDNAIVNSSNPSVTDAQRAAAKQNIADTAALSDAQRQAAARQNESPGQAYVRSLKSTSDTIEDSGVNALKSLNSQLDKSVEKSLHLHGIFGSIVDDLIDMAIKQALIKPLANAFFGDSAAGTTGLFGQASSALSGGGGGFLGSIGKLLGIGGGTGGLASVAGGTGDVDSLVGFASGGSFQIGGNGGVDQNTLAINGKNVARVGQGETLAVIPQGQMAGGRGGPMTLQQTIQVDARNSVTPADFAGAILNEADSRSRQYAGQAGATALQRSPARVQQVQILGNN